MTHAVARIMDKIEFNNFSFHKMKLSSFRLYASGKYQESSFSRFSNCKYQVFLSFRGEDTRKNFTDHLYTALVQAGIHTFRDDDEIGRGESIKSELQQAIQQ
jgi:hypothetical protein